MLTASISLHLLQLCRGLTKKVISENQSLLIRLCAHLVCLCSFILQLLLLPCTAGNSAEVKRLRK